MLLRVQLVFRRIKNIFYGGQNEKAKDLRVHESIIEGTE